MLDMSADDSDVKIEVLMHKKTGNLVEYIPNSWFGGIIFYDMAYDNKIIDENTPIIFDDDERYRLNEYENLGEL